MGEIERKSDEYVAAIMAKGRRRTPPPNLHVALAIALGESPQRTDDQLIELVAQRRRLGEQMRAWQEDSAQAHARLAQVHERIDELHRDDELTIEQARWLKTGTMP